MASTDSGCALCVHAGVDVGGTYTDAVTMTLSPGDHKEVIVSSAKHPTTADITTGVFKALATALDQATEKLKLGIKLFKRWILQTVNCKAYFKCRLRPTGQEEGFEKMKGTNLSA